MRQNEIPMAGPITSRAVNRPLDPAKYMMKLVTGKIVHRTALSMKTYIVRVASDEEIGVSGPEKRL